MLRARSAMQEKKEIAFADSDEEAVLRDENCRTEHPI